MPLELCLTDRSADIVVFPGNSAAKIDPNPIDSYRKSKFPCLFWLNCATGQPYYPFDNPIDASKNIRSRS